MRILSGREIIFEVKISGGFAQVCAIDCETGTEVFVTTPPHMSRSDQQTLALRKLEKALSNSGVITSQGNTQNKDDTPIGVSSSSKRGIVT